MRCALAFILSVITSFSFAQLFAGETNSIDPALAKQYFDELKMISDLDSGRLWGVPLYGPTMFVDPNSRSIIANQPDRKGLLTAENGAYRGSLESSVNIANTSIEWSGTLWSMIIWSEVSNSEKFDRARLLVHESWHRIENSIGIPSTVTANAQLDETMGRAYLLLECRSLSRALASKTPAEKRDAIADMLVFLHYRQSLFPNNNEDAFELHEGLAEYTGLKLCGIPDSLLSRIAAKKLQLGENSDGLANSFPYLTGPALGLLLDNLKPHWRVETRNVKGLPDLLAVAVNWHAPTATGQLAKDAELAGTRYEAAKLIADETAKKKQQDEVVENLRKRLIASGRLLIQNNNINFSYNPKEKLISFDTTAVIYKTMRLTGDFGILEVSDGILRTNNWQYFVAVAPNQTVGDSLSWDGYKLQLNSGWHLVTRAKGVLTIENE